MCEQGPFSFAAAHATLYIQGFCCQFYYLQVVPPWHTGIKNDEGPLLFCCEQHVYSFAIGKSSIVCTLKGKRKMATAITTQPTGSKKLGTVQLVNPANYRSGKKIDLECWASPVPENELHPGVKADLAVDVEALEYFESGHSYALRVELEPNSPDSYVGFGYKVFVSDPELEVTHREYMFTYDHGDKDDHGDKAIFDHKPIPFTAATEQMIGAALYYLFIDSKRDDSGSAEIPTLEQWLKEWHEIIQSNVRAQMAQFNPARG